MKKTISKKSAEKEKAKKPSFAPAFANSASVAEATSAKGAAAAGKKVSSFALRATEDKSADKSKDKEKKEKTKKTKRAAKAPAKKLPSPSAGTAVKGLAVADLSVIEEPVEKLEAVEESEAEIEGEEFKKDRYFEGVGRRKTAIARVRLFTRGEKEFLVNNKPYKNYFPILEFQQILLAALEKMKCEDKFRVQAMVKGGGIRGQAEAVRLGIARALVKFNADFKKRLRKAGFLTRDPRMRERKKFGLKRARRAPQWQKS